MWRNTGNGAGAARSRFVLRWSSACIRRIPSDLYAFVIGLGERQPRLHEVATSSRNRDGLGRAAGRLLLPDGVAWRLTQQWLQMPKSGEYDAVVVGAGPNGLAAAIRIAQEGHRVLLVERNEEAGGAARSAELTLPGFVHDLGSAVHPLGIASPFLQSLPLARHGLRWIHPEVQIGHPLDDGGAALMYRSLGATADRLGSDGAAYRAFMAPLVEAWPSLRDALLRPMLAVPNHPIDLARFGIQALMPVNQLARLRLKSTEARALFAGIAAHSGLPFHAPLSSAVALVLGLLGHAAGWPLPQGGAGSLARSLARHLEELGGEIQTGREIRSMDELPDARVTLFDVTPRQFLAIAGTRVTGRYRRALETYRYGPASFKMDYALDGPVPWTDAETRRAATVHLGGTLSEIAHSESEVSAGRIPERPYVLLTQPTVCDPSRAPEGKHVVWAYCHIPPGADTDMSGRITAQIERFAPGFRDLVLSQRATFPSGLEAQDPNLVDGDIMGGSGDLWQMIARPVLSPWPYRTPLQGVYLCSASTPPGPGVHGMCGFHAAELALRDHFS